MLKKILTALGALIVVICLLSCARDLADTIRDTDGSVVYLVKNNRVFCSGVVVDDDLVLTAHHCIVALKYDEAQVIKYRGVQLKTFVLEADKYNDLAVLQLIDPDKSFTVSDIRYVKSFDPAKGDEVFTCGSPTGVAGVCISGRLAKKNVTSWFGAKSDLYQLPAFYGNSGGPIFDSTGKIVSVVSQVGITQHPLGPYTFGPRTTSLRRIVTAAWLRQ